MPTLGDLLGGHDPNGDGYGRFGDHTGPIRWDDTLSSEPTAAQAAAQSALDVMDPRIAQHEATFENEGAERSALARSLRSGLYYDAHRARQVAGARPVDLRDVLARHLRTREIAHEIGVGAITSPWQAAKRGAEIAETKREDPVNAAREAAREFVLYRHSIALDPADRFMGEHREGVHLRPREQAPSPDEMQGLHETLEHSFGHLTRSPRMIHAAIMEPTHDFAARAQHLTAGDHVGSLVLAHDAHREDVVREMAGSLARRHLAPEFRRFATRFKARSAGSPDPYRHFSDHGYRMGRDLHAEYGHALSRALLGHGDEGHPMNEKALGPTRRTVETLGDVHRHPPARLHYREA